MHIKNSEIDPKNNGYAIEIMSLVVCIISYFDSVKSDMFAHPFVINIRSSNLST